MGSSVDTFFCIPCLSLKVTISNPSTFLNSPQFIFFKGPEPKYQKR